MSWLVKMLGVKKVRQAFARPARIVDAFTDDVEESLRKLRGKTPPAIEGPKKKAKAADAAAVAP